MAGAHKGYASARPLDFPNPSRSFDEASHGVRFWGYDQTFEVAFLITRSALSKLDPDATTDEAGCLEIFDAHCDAIRAAGGRAYLRHRKTAYQFSYILTDSDF